MRLSRLRVADRFDPRMPALWHLYDEPLPNHYAATIQILQTGAAFAAHGGSFIFLSGSHREPEEALLRRYGLEWREELRLRPFFPSKKVPQRLRSLIIAFRLQRLIAGLVARPGQQVIMTRGALGVWALPKLRRARGRSGSHPLLVHEMHGLAYLRWAEKKAGRSLREADLGKGTVRRREWEKEAVRAADALIYLTPEVETAVREAFAPECPSIILPSGTAVKASKDAAPGPIYDLVYAGKIEARKGVFDLCAVMQHLPGRTLAIAGGDERAVAAIRERLRSEHLLDRVMLLGHLDAAEVDAFLQKGRVGLCPMTVGVDSVADRFTSPMKLLQMMGNGMAVVATDSPPVRAIATHGKNAWLVPPNAPEAMAQAIERLLSDKMLAARLGAEARKTAAGYTWTTRAHNLQIFLRELDKEKLQKRRAEG